MAQTILTKDTLIPVGAVILILTASFSYGAMYQKVNNLENQVHQLNNSVQQLSRDVNQLIGANSISYNQ